MNNYGLCCLLQQPTEEYKVNRTFQKKESFLIDKENSLKETSRKIIDNIKGTINMVSFCIKNNIKVYRMSSGIFTFMEFYEFEDLPYYDKIQNLLKGLGIIIIKNNMRVSFHPDHFVKLATSNKELLEQSIKTLNQHSKIFDLMGFPADHNSHILVHIGGGYSNKLLTLQTFCDNFLLLDNNTKNRLTIENDDCSACYTVKDLYDNVYKIIKTPIVIDTFHHSLHNINIDKSVLSLEQALDLAKETWLNIRPVAHHSSSAKIHEDNTKAPKSHADYIYDKFQGDGFDVELEAKAKELALLKYVKQF